MSLLKYMYLSRVDPCYRDSQLPDPNGRLARAVPSSAISVANKSVNVCIYHETHCRCGSLERTCGRANGTANFIQRKLYRQLSAKFKFREIKALYGTRIQCGRWSISLAK